MNLTNVFYSMSSLFPSIIQLLQISSTLLMCILTWYYAMKTKWRLLKVQFLGNTEFHIKIGYFLSIFTMLLREDICYMDMNVIQECYKANKCQNCTLHLVWQLMPDPLHCSVSHLLQTTKSCKIIHVSNVRLAQNR